MEWLRWHHGAVADDKWPLVARRSGQSVAVVVAVWASLLECASQAEDRGSIDEFDPESMDALLQIEDGATKAVLDALCSGKKPRIADGRIVNWGKRQPLREDGSAERSREWRERKREEKLNESQELNADERATNAPQTHENADERATNAKKHRTEKNREEKNEELNTPPHPPQGGEGSEKISGSADPAGEKQKPKTREPTGNTLPELRAAVAEYTASEPLRRALEDFRCMRERIRKPMTGRALKLIFGELDKLASDDAGKIAILEQSILRSWQGVFALHPPQARASPPGSRPVATTQHQRDRQNQEDLALAVLQADMERQQHGNEIDRRAGIGTFGNALPAAIDTS